MRPILPMIDVLILDETHILYEGKGEHVHFRGREGEFEVAQSHAPILSLLRNGSIIIVGQKGETQAIRVPIKRGIMKMEQNRVLVMAEVPDA